jgi:predicted nucleic acid-binding protein
VTLVDAEPLVALVDAGEPEHDRCRETLDETRLPLLTTWPAFTEAVYLLGKAAGWKGQEALWRTVKRDVLVLAELSEELTRRSAELMRVHRDHAIDLGRDACRRRRGRKLRKVFSLDSHFASYQLRGDRYLELIP